MPPRRFPAEFAELLSPAGSRVLGGKHPGCGVLARGRERFVAHPGLISRRWALAAPGLLERALGAALTLMEDPIPDWTIGAMKENYAELLPKTVRVHTALMASRRSLAARRADDVGLTAMLASKSFHAFACALSGLSLRPRWGTQVLCYAPGDYAGPHNDHHPEDPDARDGYTDLHLTFCTHGVEQQFIVYEARGHLSEIQTVATQGGVTCYRLPTWHYATPLVAKPGRAATARRWVLLGTFLDRVG